MRTKLLFLLQVPPPVYGASLRNKEFFDYAKSRNPAIKLIDIAIAKRVENVGKLSISGVLRALKVVAQSCLQILISRPHLIYITPSSGTIAQLKELPALIVARALGIDVVAHFRNLGFKNNVLTLLLRKALKNQKVIIMSPRVLPALAHVVCDSKIQYLPNGLVVPQIQFAQSKVTDEIRLIYLSNWIPTKGVLESIKAVRVAAQRLSGEVKLHLTLCGGTADSDFYEMVRAEVKAAEQDGVRVVEVGFVEGREKWDYLAQAEILLFPTSYPKELFPGVVMEGMAAGCVVLGSNFVAIPDMLDNGEAGFIHDVGDVEMIADQLIFLANDRGALARIQAAARKRFLENYSSDVVLPKLYDLLHLDGG